MSPLSSLHLLHRLQKIFAYEAAGVFVVIAGGFIVHFSRFTIECLEVVLQEFFRVFLLLEICGLDEVFRRNLVNCSTQRNNGAAGDVGRVRDYFPDLHEVRVLEVRRHLQVVAEAEDAIRFRQVERRSPKFAPAEQVGRGTPHENECRRKKQASNEGRKAASGVIARDHLLLVVASVDGRHEGSDRHPHGAADVGESLDWLQKCRMISEVRRIARIIGTRRG